MNIKIGLGVDYHQLKEGLDLWIGGVKIPHTKGALGHSDADVLLHAICDALLGALALGDIGKHFPDTSEEFKGIDSKILLQRTYKLIDEAGWLIGNIDATLTLEAPKIKPHIAAMQTAIGSILDIPSDCVSVKATTAEKMGFVGREEGVMAQAVAILFKKG
ncbi:MULTISPECIES: 2-C-methyl-D-erythritol 2,4-cyclodiphosphate synthase [Chitinophagaceae]